MEASWETEQHEESCVCYGNPFAARYYCDCKETTQVLG
jgi:hypothetical protein